MILPDRKTQRCNFSILLLTVLAFTACQKDRTIPVENNKETQLTPEQINKRMNLKETAIILAKIVSKRNISKEIFTQIKYKRNGLYRVMFSRLLNSNSLKSEPNNNFRSEFIKTARKILTQSSFKSGTAGSDSVLSVNGLIDYLKQNKINVYWPYSQNWNGTETPTVTYQPFDNLVENEGFIQSSDLQLKSTEVNGLKTVNVDDDYAWKHPTLIVDTISYPYGNYNTDTISNNGSDVGTGNTGNYDVNKVFIYKVRTNGKNFRPLFGGENVITFYQGGEELINSTTPLETTFQIDRWAGRKGVWRTINLVWDSNWKPGEIQHWIGIKLHRVEKVVKTTFSGDISLKVNSSNTVATKSSSTSSGGFEIKLFAWKVEISHKDYMGKSNIWDRKQFFYENWRDADGFGLLDGLCVRAAGTTDSHARGGIFFTMRVNSYNYNKVHK